MSLFQSGPYKSQTLRSLVSQAQKLRDRLGIGVRNLRNTAILGAQILIYPGYVVFQTLRLGAQKVRQRLERPALKAGKSRRVGKASPKGNRPTARLSADAPLKATLKALENFSLPTTLPEPTPESSNVLEGVQSLKALDARRSPGGQLQPTVGALQPTPLQIRGLACRLDTCAIVLVTDTNQILDILTTLQQQQLKQRMVEALADYGRWQRLQQMPDPNQLPPIRPTRRMKPWVRRVYELMAWMEQSPVAIATNLFGEAQRAIVQDAATQSSPAGWLPQFTQQRPKSLTDQRRQIDRVSADRNGSLVPKPQGQVVITRTDAPASSAIAQTSAQSLASTQPIDSSLESPTSLTPPPYIEAEATLIGYFQTPLEAFMRWLDRGLAWIEQAIARLLNRSS